MADVKELRCVIGDCRYGVDEISYTCPEHGELGTLDILYDFAALRGQLDREAISASRLANCWRYLPLLPLAPAAKVPPLAVGWTPLYDAPRIAKT